jgi:hypothetical protein
MVETDFTNDTQQRLVTLLENLERDSGCISTHTVISGSGSAVYARLIDAVRQCLHNLQQTSAEAEIQHSQENEA